MEASAAYSAGDLANRVKLGLARLMFDEVISGENFVSQHNLESVDAVVHYNQPQSLAELTLGGIVDSDPAYIRDVCDVIFRDVPVKTKDKFLDSFLELMLGEVPGRDCRLVRDMNHLEPGKAPEFSRMLQHYLGQRQCPAIDLYLALGVYVLQKAHQAGMVTLDGNFAAARCTYHPVGTG